MENAARAIEELLAFGLARGILNPLDTVWARNALLDVMKLDAPADVDLTSFDCPPTATPILKVLLDDAVERGLIGDTVTERELFDTRLMACMMPRPSEVASRFQAIAKSQGIQAATDWFYALSRNSDYIRVDQVARNIGWVHPHNRYGDLEITINLSKPEKDPKEIAKLKNLPKSSYPACMICLDNMGYTGRLNHPNRQTLRVLPLTLNEEEWYFQYSPYVYYDQHCIVFKREHTPMNVCRASFVRLMDFLRIMPHYFIGSNAGLPVVGGSILNHDHFQGGAHELPMARAEIDERLVIPGHPGVTAGILRWPMSVVRLTGRDPQELIDIASMLLDSWQEWSDPEYDILARDPDGTLHNTFTPIARMRGSLYEFDLVLRNNVTTAEHPLGIFHPHEPLHHIKRENIGLSEVMGLFILPGRLEKELGSVMDILSGAAPYTPAAYADESHPLCKHLPWLERLTSHYGTHLTAAQARSVVRTEVGNICVQVLQDAGVYKDTPAGRKGILGWLKSVNISSANS